MTLEASPLRFVYGFTRILITTDGIFEFQLIIQNSRAQTEPDAVESRFQTDVQAGVRPRNKLKGNITGLSRAAKIIAVLLFSFYQDAGTHSGNHKHLHKTDCLFIAALIF